MALSNLKKTDTFSNKYLYNNLVVLTMLDIAINIISDLLSNELLKNIKLIIPFILLGFCIYITILLIKNKCLPIVSLIPYILLMVFAILLFIPSTDKSVKEWFFTPTIPEETESTETPTAQISSTSTDPSNPTETPTPLPSETTTTDIPTITKTPENTEIPTLSTPIEEFADSCIPSDWKIYPGYLVTWDEININEECLNLNILGFTGLKPGLNISAKTYKDNGNETAGIYHLLSIKDNFELNIKFKDLDLLSPNLDGSIIYLMFINSKDALNFTKISDFDSLFMFTNNNLYFNNKDQSVKSYIVV